jgi:hypothetical protein
MVDAVRADVEIVVTEARPAVPGQVFSSFKRFQFLLSSMKAW